MTDVAYRTAVALGYEPDRVKTERFGGTGGR